jgi:hypothetical protein
MTASAARSSTATEASPARGCVLERVGAVDRPAHERHVGGPRRQAGRRIVVVGQAQADLQLGLGRLQVREDGRGELRGGQHRIAHAQGRGASGAAGLVDRARGLGEDPARGGEQGLSGRRQPQALPVADEQLDAEPVLELGDRRAQRLLRDVEALGRVSEAPLFGDGHEVAQLADLGQHSFRL